MNKKVVKSKDTTKGVRGNKIENNESKPISYRLKCARTANGLSHFVMYGDVDKKKTLL